MAIELVELLPYESDAKLEHWYVIPLITTGMFQLVLKDILEI